MTDIPTMEELEAKLADAEAELAEWTAGGKSHWNSVHGSVTGDYAGQFQRAADADAAQVRLELSKVEGLRALIAHRRPNPLDAIAEQLRVGNIIALTTFADSRFGSYAGPAHPMTALFDYGPTPESNITLKPEIAIALGITPEENS